MSRRDVTDGYVSRAEELAALVSDIIRALEHAGSRTYGAQLRERAKVALSAFRQEQQASRQATLFGKKDNE